MNGAPDYEDFSRRNSPRVRGRMPTNSGRSGILSCSHELVNLSFKSLGVGVPVAEFPNAHLGVEVLFKIGLNHTQCFPVAVETADHQRPSRDEIMKGVDQAAC